MSLLNPNLLYPVLWLGVRGVGQQTLVKIALFIKQKRLNWQHSFKKLSTLLQHNVISLKQYQEASEYLNTQWPIKTLSQKLSEAKIKIIHQDSFLFPRSLMATQHAPYLLFAQGNISLLSQIDTRPTVAVVGTRQITPYGKLVTKKITEELAAHQAIIVSGGMYGVDAEAHQVALDAGGDTICVLGSGLARPGPYWQQALINRIIEQKGLILSEFFPWTPAHKSHFPIRNRVVAGLSKAVVVTEAAVKSGSLITASFALEYGREVCAVPGSILSPYSDGTTWLINQGATLVSSGREVIATFAEQMASQNQPTLVKNTSFIQKIAPSSISSLLRTNTSLTTEEVASHLEAPVTEALLQLSELELQGHIVTQGGRWYLAS